MAPRQLRDRDGLRGALRPPPGPRFTSFPHGSRRPPKPVSRPPGYYLPVPLRWPFLGLLMVVLAATLGVLVALQQAMPNSDHSAVVDGRPMARSVQAIHVVDTTVYHDLALRRIPRLRRQTNDTYSPAESNKETQSTTLAPSSAGTSTDTSTTASLSIRSTTKKKSKSLPLVHGGHVPNGPATGQPTSLVISKPPDPSVFANATISDDVNRSRSKFVTPGVSQTITEIVTANTASSTAPQTQQPTTDDVFFTAATIGDPILRPIIPGGTTTSIVRTKTVTPPPQTKTDSAGRTTVVSYPPTQIETTVPGVIIPQTIQTPLPDDKSFGGEINTLATVVGASSVTRTTVFTSPGKLTTQTYVSVVDGSSVTQTTIVSLPGQLTTQTYVSVEGGSSATLLVAFPTTVGPSVETLVSVVGGTVMTITPSPTTFVSDLGGGVLTTITSTPTPYITTTGGRTTTMLVTKIPTLVITTDIATFVNGTPTTIKTVVTITPTPRSAPTPTPKPGGSDDGTRVRILSGFSPAQFFAFTYLPTIIAACLAVPFSMISTNAQLMQPFHTLATRPGGGPASDTLSLSFGGYWSVLTSLVQAFRHGEPVPLIANLGSLVASVLAPLSAEAIGFKVHGTCTHLDIAGCGITPGISPAPTQALITLVAALAMLLLMLVLVLRRWDTGIYADPRGLAAAASLSMDPSLRGQFNGQQLSDKKLEENLKGGLFRLAFFDADAEWDESCYEYGIIASERTETPPLGTRSTVTTTAITENGHHRRHMPFLALTYTSRTILVTALLGLISLLAYYHQPSDDTPFELFMDSQTFGVKFLFASIGTVISMFWRSFFEGVAAAAPFVRMARQPCLAGQGILRSPATNSLTGIMEGARQRDFLLFASAVMAGIAELLLPALLANIPYALTQTYDGHVGATAASLAILGIMVILLTASLIFVRWPHLPVDPRTLAGAIYYVSRSERLLADLKGQRLALLDEASCQEYVEGLKRRYMYKPLGGDGRMAVEVEIEEDEMYREGMEER